MTSRRASEGESRPDTCVIVRGDDPSLVGQALRRVVHELLDGGDASELVEEHGGPADEEIDVGRVLDALSTAPFLAPRRIVVVRDAGRLQASDAVRLLAWLEDPVPGCILVLASGGGSLPAQLVKAVERSGRVVSTAAGTGRERGAWMAGQLAQARVRLDAGATQLMSEHLGEDLGRLDGILEALAGAYGEGARVGVEELAPFLGGAGKAAPWDLTDAIDAGDTARALYSLGRLLGPGAMHPLAVSAVLQRHFRSMLRLDGLDVQGREAAAELLGVRSAFVAGKALEQSRRLGHSGVVRAIEILARADLDMRGGTGLAPELVLEIAVARLSRLLPARSGRRARPARRVAR